MRKMEKIPGSGVGDHFSGLQQNDARGQEQRFADVVSDENNGFFEAMREGGKFSLQFSASDGIKRSERFIH